MAEGNNYDSIGPLNATAGKEGMSLMGTIVLIMILWLVAYYLIGLVANL